MGTFRDKYETERGHSAFLKKLLKTLYGDDWDKLTLSDAKAWHEKHMASQPADPSGLECDCPVHYSNCNENAYGDCKMKENR